MATEIDVLNAITALCTATLYPNGTTDPVSPRNNAQTRVYPGWPDSTQLDTDLGNGIVTVSVFTGNVSRNTTRFIDGWRPYGTVTAGTPGSQMTAREVRRVRREIQITTWAPTPQLRDLTNQAIDLALASIDRLPLADTSVANISYSRDMLNDVPQKALLYKRDLFYWVEYGTFIMEAAPLVTEIDVSLQGGVVPADTPVQHITVTQG